MKQMYSDLNAKVLNYSKYSSVNNEQALIESLDEFVDNLYSKENYPHDTYSSRHELKNMYRNLILLVINDYSSGKLIQFPKSIEQLRILINGFYDIELDNPIALEGRLMRADLEKPEELRTHTNHEWDMKMDLAFNLAKYWDGQNSLNLYDIHNSLFREYPRVGILKHWDYGLDPQSFIDLENSSKDRLAKSSYLKEAEANIVKKYGRDYVLHAKYDEPNIYHGLLFDEILSLQYSYHFEDDAYDSSLDPIAQAEELMEEDFNSIGEKVKTLF